MKSQMVLLSEFSILLGLAACNDRKAQTARIEMVSAVPQETKHPGRWYTQEQVTKGEVLYQANCATCHKPDATGTVNWREPDTQGKYPPPPLDGTAHTWHHPLTVLRRTVRVGGIPLGGSMPGFTGRLNAKEIEDILAWVQSHWSDEIYRVWHKRNVQASKPLQPINKG